MAEIVVPMAEASGDTALEVIGVTKRFQGVEALGDVSMARAAARFMASSGRTVPARRRC